MASSDIQRYKRLIQFSLNDKDIEIILHKLKHPVHSLSTFNRRKLLLLLNNSSEPTTIIDVIVNHQKMNQKECSIEISETPSLPNSNNNLTIKMKKLYFFRNFQALTNWEVISCKHLLNCQNLINQSKIITFNLPEKIKMSLLRGDKDSWENFILLRFVKINSNEDEYYDSYPLNLKLSLNHDDYSHLLPREITKKIGNKKERANYPTLLNKLVLDAINSNEKSSKISIIVSYNNKSMADFDYSLQIVTCEEVPENEIVDMILKKPKRSIEDFMKEFKKYLICEGDVIIEKMRVILKGSVFIQPIEIPFRGKNCTHLMPDDLRSYIKINRVKEDWMCKICKMPCNPDEVIIDQFYVDVLANNPYATVIDIYKNGKVEVIEESNLEENSDDSSLEEESQVKYKRCCLKTGN
uniref:SP-RING-type domain-containing protein n=1 Tax=Strongyloides stercoralis TaxID=6248 RepID=A0A0K0EQS3_STRER